MFSMWGVRLQAMDPIVVSVRGGLGEFWLCWNDVLAKYDEALKSAAHRNPIQGSVRASG